MKRRKRSTRSIRARTRHNPINPARRRSTKRRGRRSAVYARRRNPINPTRRRRLFGRRRRNPGGGLLGRAIPLVIGSAAIGITAPFVNQAVIRFAPQLVTTPVGVAAVTFGTGWLLSALTGMFAFTRRWKDDVLLAGAVLAGGQVFTAYVAPALRLNRGNGGLGRYGYRNGYRNGMRGIGVMTNIPPGVGPGLPPAQNGASNGIQGIGVMTNIPPGYPR